MSGTIHGEARGSTAWIVIDNGPKANAMTFGMWQALPECIGSLAADPAVRVIAVTGAGEAFVSGADVSEFETLRASPEGAAAYDRAVEAAVGALRECPHPTLAAIRGYCLGGGIGLALACDMRYAREDAVFGIPAARLGVGYSLALTRDLVRATGPAHAREILYTARRYGAREAERMGLVTRVYGTDRWHAAVEELCGELARNAPLTIRAAKCAIAESVSSAPREDLVAALVSRCFASEDYAEGLEAFLEKRQPVFKGR